MVLTWQWDGNDAILLWLRVSGVDMLADATLRLQLLRECLVSLSFAELEDCGEVPQCLHLFRKTCHVESLWDFDELWNSYLGFEGQSKKRLTQVI